MLILSSLCRYICIAISFLPLLVSFVLVVEVQLRIFPLLSPTGSRCFSALSTQPHATHIPGYQTLGARMEISNCLVAVWLASCLDLGLLAAGFVSLGSGLETSHRQKP